MIRTAEQWMAILEPLGASPTEAAARILGDIVHYRHGGAYESDDRKQLANALHAWFRLCRGDV